MRRSRAATPWVLGQQQTRSRDAFCNRSPRRRDRNKPRSVSASAGGRLMNAVILGRGKSNTYTQGSVILAEARIPCPYGSPVPQVSASGDGAAVPKPGAGDACGGDLPREFFVRCNHHGKIRGVDASRHAARRYEYLARSVRRFSPDFRATRCAWIANECSDDGDHASTIRVSPDPSQRVHEAFSCGSFSRRPCHA